MAVNSNKPTVSGLERQRPVEEMEELRGFALSPARPPSDLTNNAANYNNNNNREDHSYR